MSKAGKGDSVDTGAVGSQHPVPENIPHLSNPAGGSNGISSLLHPHQHHPSMQAGSPVKESSFLNRETSAEDLEAAENNKTEDKPPKESAKESETAAQSAAGEKQELPVRR